MSQIRTTNQIRHLRSLERVGRKSRSRSLQRCRFVSIALAFVILLLSGFVPASAEFKPGKYIQPSPVSNWFVRHVRKGVIKRLELSDAQLAQINEKIDPHREQLMREVEAAMAARVHLLQTIRTEPYDGAAVGLTFEELRATELVLLVHAGEVYQDAWSLLSSEQKAEADEIVAEIVTAAELRFLDFREGFLAGELLGLSTH